MRILRTAQEMLPSLFIMVAASIVVSFFLGFDTFEGCLATSIMTLAPVFLEKYRALPEPERRPADSRSPKKPLEPDVLPPSPRKEELVRKPPSYIPAEFLRLAEGAQRPEEDGEQQARHEALAQAAAGQQPGDRSAGSVSSKRSFLWKRWFYILLLLVFVIILYVRYIF